MRRYIVESLIILLVNIVVGGLATASIILFVTRDDPILAAIPAIVALPGIVLQPWFVVFWLLPRGPLLAPGLTTAVSVPLYILLDWKGKLDRAKGLLAHLATRRFIFATMVLAGLMGAFGLARYVDFPALHRGIPRTLQSAVEEKNLTVSDSKYYCLGSFIDSEWVWRAKLSEQDLDALAERFEIHPIDRDRVDDHFLNMPPYWWRPVLSDRVRVLATDDFPADRRGPDGWHALATWNPEDKVLHMWIKDNF